MNPVTAPLLSIGEFAAATQLSPKALRLYDEQGLLSPAMIDAANGYRYYRREQVASGRLVRILRDMDLSLVQIAHIIAADPARAPMLLRESSLEIERRFARQKQAFQKALMVLGRHVSTAAPEVTQRERKEMSVCIAPFVADRHSLFARFQAEVGARQTVLLESGVSLCGDPLCFLVDPISDDEGRFEAALPVRKGEDIRNLDVRYLPSASCAIWVAEFLDTSALDMTAALDALFDWLDRNGYRAIEQPSVTFHSRDSGCAAELSWACALTR